jgi:glycosyltransferase involved in cell wall biosynthesis
MSAMQQPLVSIIIPNHNYAQYLSASIQSALDQSYPSVEVIVVDDGSTDDSRLVIESFGSRIRTIYQENQGQTAANNAGFSARTSPRLLWRKSIISPAEGTGIGNDQTNQTGRRRAAMSVACGVV